ncbi:NAD-dependent malic enzyme 2 [Perilla frutescens var. hirtella]|uniref:Malic enzyme n=1 Tax=Perilla frutescens var. hirtella TaxID=608512 RepID=A0AAD4JRV4_PERFH|nr:NAD-dependent malic enzyme 2 [Perilla frutescens var. hirtella]
MWRVARSAASSLRQSQRRMSTAIPGPCIVHKRGSDILHDPWFNKDTGFPLTERDRLGLRGLLPPRVISFEQQYDRFMESYRSLERNTKGQPDNVVTLAKWRILNRLHDRNETLYYRALIDNIKNFAPIIYTPTVGLVCQNYSGLFRRPRGMYFSAKDKGEMMSMIYNWPAQQVDMIVLTDGSRILGLGDLGVQGIGIPIGKLDMYVAAAGINPQRILPVMLDVGTNNQKLLEDRLYLGLRQPRLEGEEYLAIVDEFMEAVHARWPKAIVQFEDFQMKWAFETLDRYRKRFCMFNDDIQGTAGVALAGLLGSVRAQGKPLTDFANQKIVVVGAGSAGLGVLKMALQAVSRMAGPDADPHFFLLDKDGLITKERKCIDPAAVPFAKSQGEIGGLGLREGSSLLEVVKKVKPHVLLGLSGVGGVFNEEILRAMGESDSIKPAIFAMSNPTANAECTADQAFKHAGENIVFASGSPFDNVVLGNGKIGHVNQANNMYLFPGIGLGSLLSGARIITDEMLQAASQCLASYMTDEEIQRGILYPSIDSIRDITAEVGAAVLRAAIAEEVAEGHGEVGPRELSHMSKDETVQYVKDNMWYPVYSPLVHEKYAVVTGSNKGIGLEICRQLASEGVTVVMTARDEKRGLEAVEKLKASGLSDFVMFHQLDVSDQTSIASFAQFLQSHIGKLDILINNAGIGGALIDGDAFRAASSSYTVNSRFTTGGGNINWSEIMSQTYDLAIACLRTNYYGTKLTTEALLPLLHLSASPRIVNVSSSMGKLKNIPNEWAKGVLNNVENLTEERIDEVINEFLKDFKEGCLEAKGWPQLAAYTVSKAAMNAYTRLLANKYPSFRVNCVCPGYVRTDINFNTGVFTVEEGAECPVMAALLPDDGPSGVFIVRKEVSSFED